MIPKTAFQRKVAGFKAKLKPVTDKQISWGYDQCFEKRGRVQKQRAGCFECGHSWKIESNLVAQLAGCECPACGQQLKMDPTPKRTRQEVAYMSILTTSNGFQVVRTIFMKKTGKIGGEAEYFAKEVMQHWISEKGKALVFSRSVGGFSYYYDNWLFFSDMEMRSVGSQRYAQRHLITPNRIYPRQSILPIIKRNGFMGDFCNMQPARFFEFLLSDNKAETLLKTGQTSMFQYHAQHRDHINWIDEYWPSIKICIRNGYAIPDASTWKDYISLLRTFNKDLLSSVYVCPVDLHKSHNKLVEKRIEQQRRARLEQQRQEMEAAQLLYEQQKGKFFGVAFSDGDLTVKVLESVSEFEKEGYILKHCVFTNGYYKMADSLVLSARIGEQLIETIELSLSSLQIRQSRGLHNKATEHHEKIINLVTQNLPAISRLLK